MRVSTSTLDEVGDIDAEPGSRPWALAVRLEIQSALNDAESAASRVRRLIAAMEEHSGHRALADERGKPFGSFEAFCMAKVPFGLGREPFITVRAFPEAIASAAISHLDQDQVCRLIDLLRAEVEG